MSVSRVSRLATVIVPSDERRFAARAASTVPSDVNTCQCSSVPASADACAERIVAESASNRSLSRTRWTGWPARRVMSSGEQPARSKMPHVHFEAGTRVSETPASRHLRNGEESWRAAVIGNDEWAPANTTHTDRPRGRCAYAHAHAHIVREIEAIESSLATLTRRPNAGPKDVNLEE